MQHISYCLQLVLFTDELFDAKVDKNRKHSGKSTKDCKDKTPADGNISHNAANDADLLKTKRKSASKNFKYNFYNFFTP